MTIEIDHIGLSVSDYARAKDFYLAALAPLGIDDDDGAPEEVTGGFRLAASAPTASRSSGSPPAAEATHLISPSAPRARKQVDAFHAAALAAGGKDNGAPGHARDVSPELLRRLRARSRRPQHRSGVPRAADGDLMAGARLTGGCQCGAVRYALHEQPANPHICHCRMCQKAFGSFFAPLTGVPLTSFEMTRGALATFHELRQGRARLLPRLRHAADLPRRRQPDASRSRIGVARRAGEGRARACSTASRAELPYFAALPACPARRRPKRTRRELTRSSPADQPPASGPRHGGLAAGGRRGHELSIPPDRRLPVRRGALCAARAADEPAHLPLPHVPEGVRLVLRAVRPRAAGRTSS